MSAFAVIFERSNTPVKAGVLERVMNRLQHRGPDGSDLLLLDRIQMGHWHFWTTPEDVGERQPLALTGLPFTIVFDGRIDNRSDLISALALSVDGRELSDAALVIHAYGRWQERCVEHFVGEFAFVLFDSSRNELICARDPLGDRTLYYAFDASSMIIASEPWAVAGAFDEPPSVNENVIALHFSMKVPEDGCSFFKGIRELLPAQALKVDCSNERYWFYWQADLSARIRYRSDSDYAEHFRSLLEESVRCRLRSNTSVGVMMSGGLDSTSVACLAARMLAPLQLTTISYVFDELTVCDERQYIETVIQQWGIRSLQIPCDDAWPFKDLDLFPANQNHPAWNPFRTINERVYQCANREGLRVLLTGLFGDYLYAGAKYWFADLLMDGRIRDALSHLEIRVRSSGWRSVWDEGLLQKAARKLINTFPGGARLRRNDAAPSWLTPFAGGQVQEGKSELSRPHRHNVSMLSLGNAQGSSSEVFYTSRHSMELRHPYRDRRLIEFVLALPAYQLFHDSTMKYILRNAMQGILPEAIRARKQPTFLTPLFFRGIEMEKIFLQNFVGDSNGAWCKFVGQDWLSKLKSDEKGHAAFVRWLCVAFELWHKNYSKFSFIS